MGSSARAKLCYGYYFGGDDDGWRIAEVGEDGFWPDADDPSELIEAAANQVPGLSMEFTGSYDYSGYVLSAHTAETHAGTSALLDLHQLEVQRIAEDWDGKLARALERLDVTPVDLGPFEEGSAANRKPVGPSWLLVAFYG